MPVPVRKRHLLPFIFVALHTSLVCLVAFAVWRSDDPETGMLWILFDFVDFPVSVLFMSSNHVGVGIAVVILIFGGLQWALIGYGLTRLGDWLRRKLGP